MSAILWGGQAILWGQNADASVPKIPKPRKQTQTWSARINGQLITGTQAQIQAAIASIKVPAPVPVIVQPAAKKALTASDRMNQWLDAQERAADAAEQQLVNSERGDFWPAATRRTKI